MSEQRTIDPNLQRAISNLRAMRYTLHTGRDFDSDPRYYSAPVSLMWSDLEWINAAIEALSRLHKVSEKDAL